MYHPCSPHVTSRKRLKRWKTSLRPLNFYLTRLQMYPVQWGHEMAGGWMGQGDLTEMAHRCVTHRWKQKILSLVISQAQCTLLPWDCHSVLFCEWGRPLSLSVLTGSRCTSGETQINAIDFPGGGSQRYFVQMLPFSLQILHCLVILCLAWVSSSFLYLYPHASWQASCSAGYWEKKAENTLLLLISKVVSFIGWKTCYFYTTSVS